MAIQRLKSPYYIPVAGEPTAYAPTPTFGTTYEFESTGQAGTVLGTRYRVHRFDVTQNGTLYFTQGGYVDVMLVAGGGSGGNGIYSDHSVSHQQQSSYGGGGGGAGGVNLTYQYLVESGINYGVHVGHAGNNTTFAALTGYAGGVGAGHGRGGGGGGSGGGANAGPWTGTGAPGTGVSPQGKNGGQVSTAGSGGGGYATTGYNSGGNGGRGGDGLSITFDGVYRRFAAGGGGGGWQGNGGGQGGHIDGQVVGANGGSAHFTANNQHYPFNGNTSSELGCGGGGGGVHTSGHNSHSSYSNSGGTNGVIFIRYVV